MKRKEESGSAVVEFAFCCLLLMPLLLGLVAIGFSLTRELKVVQACRDAGHMYAKGVDFSTSSPPNPNRTTLINIANGLGLTDPEQSPGTVSPGTIILTTIMLTTPADCAAGGYPNGCANQGTPVITNQIKIGDTGIASSFGTPTSGNYLTDTGDQATNVPSSIAQFWVPNQGGQFAYASEVVVRFHDLDWTGYIGSTTSATSIF